jgi:hypothetical protein
MSIPLLSDSAARWSGSIAVAVSTAVAGLSSSCAT